MTEDVAERYEAYGWHVLDIGDDLSVERIERATREAMAVEDRPSLIIVQSHIGYGSPNKQDTSSAHGSPLGEDEVRLTKEAYGWDPDKQFYVPDEALEHFRRCCERGRSSRPSGRSASTPTARQFPEQARAAGDDRRRRDARRLGRRRAAVRSRRRSDRHPQGL